MASRISSISQALAGNTSAMAIPKPRDAVAAAASAPKHGPPTSGLPTPPNSISPNLPPHSLKARIHRDWPASPPAAIDSDIDLLDAVEHANSHSLQRHGSVGKASTYNGSDSHGIITPQYLAKFHLPDVFRGNGPVAIKDIMEQLSKAVPGFADITAAKARRIVVAALESRSGGGVQGDVEFEKVGWGKWDARVRGVSRPDRRDMYTIEEGNISPPASTAGSQGATRALRIPSNSKYLSARKRRQSRGSSAQDTAYSRSEIMAMGVVEHDVDEMSIDEEEDVPVRFHAPRISSNPPPEDDYSDTDEEDWASIGAAGLRSRSYGSTGGILPIEMNRARTRTPASAMTQSVPTNRMHIHEFQPLDFTGVDADLQEREAIEALMRMGAM